MKKEPVKAISTVLIVAIVIIATAILALVVYTLVPKNSEQSNNEALDLNSTNTQANEMENIAKDTNIVENTIDENTIDENKVEEALSPEEEMLENEDIEEDQEQITEVQNEEQNNSNNSDNTFSTPSYENAPSTNQNTTPAHQEPVVEEEPEPFVVDTIEETVLSDSSSKYGVVTNTYTTTTYEIYSDGTREEIDTSTDVEVDASGYSATTSELLPEANQLKSQNSSLIESVLNYTNEYREEANDEEVNGVSNRSALVLDSNLTTAACARAMEMAYAEQFSHTRPDGRVCYSILSDMGISYMACGENISSYWSAKSTSEAWKNSPGHYANMINPSYSKIGIGVIRYQGSYYWVQIFTN